MKQKIVWTVEEIIKDTKGILLDFPNGSMRDEWEQTKNKQFLDADEVKKIINKVSHNGDLPMYRQTLLKELGLK